jgi:hypothetical protein
MISNRRSRLVTPFGLACAAFAIAALSCRSDSTGPGTALPFTLTAHVTYPGGSPAAGIQVAFWNDLSYEPITLARATPGIRKTAAATSLHFGVPVRSHVRVTVLDLLSNPFGPAIVDTILEAGYYRSIWGTDTVLPIAVLKCVMEARDAETDALLERKNTAMLLYQPDELRSRNGYSDPNGLFRTSNAQEFPNVFSLPTIVHTTDDPTPLDYIRILDSVTVVLNDTISGLHQRYRRKIVPGDNALSFVFSPTEASPSSVTPQGAGREPARLVRIGEGPIPTAFSLEQNYPNPFN